MRSNDTRMGKWKDRCCRCAVLAGCAAILAVNAAQGDGADPPRGLRLNTPAAFAGYTLFAPLNATTTYLVDMQGNLVHSWPSAYEPGQSVYLLDDGSLLRSAREPRNRHFEGGGVGGRVERLAHDGRVLWSFVYADAMHCQHHDIEPLPNGHVLLIAWEKKTRAEFIAAGGDPALMRGEEIWPDSVVEVAPQGETGGTIVWEWHAWDHVIQEYDESKPNYGSAADHPERVDLNFTRQRPRESPAELERLRALGYVAGGDTGGEGNGGDPPHRLGGGGPDMRADWQHTNAIAYNASLDQIALSVHTFNEIWIIDHSTTPAEAASHAGGRSGKGGDLLYRWGNPSTYGAGGADDQVLFAQHDIRWIPAGCPGAGHLLVFNNGMGRPGERYSAVVEFAPPIEAGGRYRLEPNRPFGPAEPEWVYTAPVRGDFFASHISGAERLPNGNTLICSGEEARIFEVTVQGKVVWDYVNPYQNHDRAGGDMGRGRGERPDGPPRGRPPHGPPDGVHRGPPGGGPGGGGPGGLFRATRIALEDSRVRRLLEAKQNGSPGGGEE